MPDMPMRKLLPRLYYAAPGVFVSPGLYLWAFSRNLRILPIPRVEESMSLVEFPEQTVVYAKDQPEYRPLPAHRVARDPQGTIICCWRLNWYARLHVMLSGRIWHSVLTFNQPLQPQLLQVEKPRMSRE